jgi:hypothetical protein
MAKSRWISVMVVGALATGADAQPAPAVEAAAPVELTAPRADSLSGRLFLADTAVLTPAAATRVTWRLFELGFRHGVTERLELMAGAMVAPGDDGSVGGYGQLKLGVLQRPRLAAALTLGVGVGPSGSHELFGVGGAAITACLDRQCWVLVNAGAHLTQTADGLGPIALGGVVLAAQARHQLAGGRDAVDRAQALAAAPDVLPRLGAGAAAEVHLRRVAARQRVGIEPGVGDRGPEVVAVHAGEQVGVDDVRGAAVDDRLLVRVDRVGLAGGDERRAHVREVRAHRLGGQHRAAGGDRPGQHQGPDQNRRISSISANGDSVPAWPPAPVHTAINPSAPLSSAFLAWVTVMMSCSTRPPQACTRAFTSSRAPSEVITSGTRCCSHTARSCSSRSFLIALDRAEQRAEVALAEREVVRRWMSSMKIGPTRFFVKICSR